MHSILLSFLCLLVGTHSYDLFAGDPLDKDADIVYARDVYKLALPFIVRTSTIDFPKPGDRSYDTITAILVMDNDSDGTGGYPSITYGGIGQKFVRINVDSQRGEGLNFTVMIWGKHVLW